MAYSLWTVTKDGGLTPADDTASRLRFLKKPGMTVRAEMSEVRSPQQLRMWWAQMDVAFENLPDGVQKHYGDKHGLHAAALCELGYCTEVRRKHKDGSETIIQRPHSIALGNMPQERFNELFNKASDLLAATLGTDAQSLRREAAESSLPGYIQRNTVGAG